MDVTFHEKEPFYSVRQNDNDTCSKGENSIKEISDRGAVMIPIMDSMRLEDEKIGRAHV